MHVSGPLAQIGNVLTFVGEDGPYVFQVEQGLHKGFEILVVAEEEV